MSLLFTLMGGMCHIPVINLGICRETPARKPNAYFIDRYAALAIVGEMQTPADHTHSFHFAYFRSITGL